MYVVVWRIAGIDLHYRRYHLMRRSAERLMTKERRRYPGREYRIERKRIV